MEMKRRQALVGPTNLPRAVFQISVGGEKYTTKPNNSNADWFEKYIFFFFSILREREKIELGGL